jgi:ubiquinone/menaquinone biosynthesis C-methylase UbiE
VTEVPDFYPETLTRLLDSGWLRKDDRVLVVCGGPVDHEAMLAAGLRNVVISNLDQRMDDDGRYAPLEWSYQDVESLTYDDASFDICIVHDGLHHCRSPHLGLLEMLRVSRRGALAFEPRDNGIVRLGVRLNFGQRYETAAVAYNDLRFGGMRNSAVPNYVHRWTEREVEKTVRAALPEGEPQFQYFHALRIPEQRLEGMKSSAQRRAVEIGMPILRGLSKAFPKQTNGFAFAITKPRLPTDLHPWLRDQAGVIGPDPDWFETAYHLDS